MIRTTTFVALLFLAAVLGFLLPVVGSEVAEYETSRANEAAESVACDQEFVPESVERTDGGVIKKGYSVSSEECIERHLNAVRTERRGWVMTTAKGLVTAGWALRLSAFIIGSLLVRTWFRGRR